MCQNKPELSNYYFEINVSVVLKLQDGLSGTFPMTSKNLNRTIRKGYYLVSKQTEILRVEAKHESCEIP